MGGVVLIIIFLNLIFLFTGYLILECHIMLMHASVTSDSGWLLFFNIPEEDTVRLV